MVTRLSKKFIAVVCLLSLAACSMTPAPPHTANPGAGKTPRPDLGSSAAFDPQGRLWAVFKDGDHVAIRRSENNGQSWSETKRINATPEPIAADGDSRPKIAVGTRGELYVTWTRPLSKPYTGEIRFARSLDGGATFDIPTTVHKDRQEITHRFDALTVNPDGKIFVAWVDKRDLEEAKRQEKSYRGAAVYFAVSHDRGESFRGDYSLADNSCECCRIALLPRADGGVVAFWRHVFVPNIRDHALAVMYPDGRAGDMRRATFDDWAVDACPHHGPSLAADDRGRLHAVWFTQGEKRNGVYYGRLNAQDVEASRRIGDDTAAHADLAIAGQHVVVAWKQFDGERSLLRIARSNDGGAQWREQTLATTAGASDQPRVLVREGNFYVYWHTRLEPNKVVRVP